MTLSQLGGQRPPVAFTGTPNQRYVQSLYNDLLHRTASLQEIAPWVALLNQGAPKTTVVQSLMSSSEYARDIVNQLYMTYLNRPADPQALSQWGGLLKAGTPVSTVVVAILTSPEYVAKATS